jgi:hypothetical protein
MKKTRGRKSRDTVSLKSRLDLQVPVEHLPPEASAIHAESKVRLLIIGSK